MIFLGIEASSKVILHSKYLYRISVIFLTLYVLHLDSLELGTYLKPEPALAAAAAAALIQQEKGPLPISLSLCVNTAAAAAAALEELISNTNKQIPGFL